MARLFVLLVLLAPGLIAQPQAVAVNIDNVIHPITMEVVSHAIAQAQRQNAPFVLIRLNTPGGMLEATRNTVARILDSPVPVVTFVRPSGAHAASAGFFILLAGDVAAMTEGTNTGAATPVQFGEPMDPVMRKKVESDTAASIRGLAGRRGRDPKVAESAVLEARSFTPPEALDKKLIDLVVRDETELLAKLDGRTITRPNGSQVTLKTAGLRVADYELSLRERAVSAIADPNLAFLLLVVGALLVYVEVTTPGVILPGVAGSIMVLVALLSLSVLPINSAGVALLLLSLALFALELKVTSHGVLGVGGAIAMIFGAMILVEGPPEMRIRLTTALAAGVPFALIAIFLVSIVVKARLRPVATGREALLRTPGVAWTDLNPAGTVLIHGEYWNADAVQPIPRGAPVRVISVAGLRLRVEPASKAAQ